MRVVVTLAATGDVLMDQSSDDFIEMRGWQFRLLFADHTHSSVFEWKLLTRSQPMDDTEHIHMMTEARDGIYFTLELSVQAVRQPIDFVTEREMHQCSGCYHSRTVLYCGISCRKGT